MIRRRMPRSGAAIAAMLTDTATASSAMATGVFPRPPVAAVAAGRTTVDLAVWTAPDTSNPVTRASAGCRSLAASVEAAKTMAPAVGRVKVWTASLTWLIRGALSAKVSIRMSTVREMSVAG